MSNFKLLLLTSICSFNMAYSTDFSPEEIVGEYESEDKNALVKVNKILVTPKNLFEEAKYRYSVDVTFDAGPCWDIDSDERIQKFTGASLQYNGTWKPEEFLSAGFNGDSDYDGDTFVADVDFTAKKITKNSTSNNSESVKTEINYLYNLSFSLSHNPSNEEESSEEIFEKCDAETNNSWTLIKK